MEISKNRISLFDDIFFAGDYYEIIGERALDFNKNSL